MPVRNIGGLVKAIWSLRIGGELFLTGGIQELIRRASTKLPCRYFTKTGAFTVSKARVTDALFLSIESSDRLRLPTTFHYFHHMAHVKHSLLY